MQKKILIALAAAIVGASAIIATLPGSASSSQEAGESVAPPAPAASPPGPPATTPPTNVASAGAPPPTPGSGISGVVDRRWTCDDVSLTAEPLDGGAIRLVWILPDHARGVILLRDGIEIAGLPQPAESHLDETTVVGENYVYTLALYYPGDARDDPSLTCQVEATSVPVFGNMLAASTAVGLGLLAYAGARRRP